MGIDRSGSACGARCTTYGYEFEVAFVHIFDRGEMGGIESSRLVVSCISWLAVVEVFEVVGEASSPCTCVGVAVKYSGTCVGSNEVVSPAYVHDWYGAAESLSLVLRWVWTAVCPVRFDRG